MGKYGIRGMCNGKVYARREGGMGEYSIRKKVKWKGVR